MITVALLGLGAGQVRRAPFLSGPASGFWELSEGVVLGTLDSVDGARTVYQLQATLAPWPVMCPACLVGDVFGTLDDGRGTGPDFIVAGHYEGVTFGGGSGGFELAVRTPGGSPAVSVRGRFEGDSSFAGRYAVRP